MPALNELKQQNAKGIMDASIWVMFVSKNSYTRALDQSSLLNSPIIIPRYGFHFRSTDLTDKPLYRIPVQCVNKLGKR